MPQLDQVTYMSQFFWLVFFFFSFYIILIKSMIPKIVTILKLRKKKLENIYKEIESYRKEESTILSNYDSKLKNSFVSSKNLIQQAVNDATSWVQQEERNLNNKSFSKANESYLSSIYQLGKEQMAFKKINQLL